MRPPHEKRFPADLAASSGHFEIDLVFCSVDWAARHRELLVSLSSRLQHATAWTATGVVNLSCLILVYANCV
jgi:hypothetical protein